MYKIELIYLHFDSLCTILVLNMKLGAFRMMYSAFPLPGNLTQKNGVDA